MASDIIYVCDSVNNKNVREGELVILRKYEDQKYFEFGENEMNIKKRYYKDLKTLNKDFDELTKLKEKSEKEEIILENPKEELIVEESSIVEPVEEPIAETKKVEEKVEEKVEPIKEMVGEKIITKKTRKKNNKKISLF